MKHIASGAIPARARFVTTSRTASIGAPLSMSDKTRGEADSTPSAHATAPARRSVSARSAVRYFSGFKSVAHLMSRPASMIPCASLSSVFGATESCER